MYLSCRARKDFTSFGCNNTFLRSLLQSKCILLVTTHWNSLFKKRIDWSKVWMTPHKYCITNKVKEVSYKIFHRVYPVKSLVVQRFKVNIEDICAFCKISPETINHLFWDCPKTHIFWKELSNYLQRKVMTLLTLKKLMLC